MAAKRTRASSQVPDTSTAAKRTFTSSEVRDLLMAAHDGEDSDRANEESNNEQSGSEDDRNDAASADNASMHSDEDQNGDHPDGWINGANFQPVIHQFHGNAGIKVDTTDFELVDFFRLFIDDDLLNCFVIETNRYAEQWKSNNAGELAKKKCRVHKWVPVTKDDVLKFLGLTLLMGLIRKPCIELYWSTDELFKTPVFGRIMSRDRYQEILRFFHIVDNTNAPDPKDRNCERMFLLYTYLKAFRPSGIYVCTWSERAWTCRRLPLGPTFKFRALCTGAVSISCSARFVEVTVQLMLRADL